MILLLTIKYHIPEVVTGLIGVAFIIAALVSSVLPQPAATATTDPPGATQDLDPATAAV